MHFYLLLKSGASTKNVALEFVNALLEKSYQQAELDLQLTCNFVNDLLAAIGLQCLLTPEHINEDDNYIWPMEQIQIYSFHYVALDFKKVEEFLLHLCNLMQLQHDTFLEDVQERREEYESPVEFLMQLIAVWCRVYKQLQKLEDLQLNKRFEEPLARINFHLLLGMHDLRKLYRLDLHLLDAICQRLYWSALQGLFYKQTHDIIFNGLLHIFSKDFDLFYNNNAKTIHFFYEAFSVEFNNSTPLIIYQTLQIILNELENEDKLNIITNFLIEPFMLKVYFTTLLGKLTKKSVEKIQHECLKFLDVLQSKLISLDCFSREFMESILNLVFKSAVVTATLACSLYIKMMKRKFSNQMILKHLMNFYASHVISIVELKSYMLNVYKRCNVLLNFNNLLEIITDSTCTDVVRLLSSHMLVIIFEIKYQENASSNLPELELLLQILPEIFENLQCQKCERILLLTYSHIPLEELKKQTLDNFIHYAVGVFTYIDNNLEYPLLMNLFQALHKCLIFNREWQHLEILTDHLLSKYREMIRDLKKREQQQMELITQHNLLHYNNVLKRLSIILKTKYELLDNNYLEVINDLLHFFVYNQEIKSVILQQKSLIDLYALEIVISLLLKVIKSQTAVLMENTSFALQVQQLFNYLWSCIKDMDNLLKSTVVHVKTYFCCLLNLCCHLPLKLNTDDYYQLIQVLIFINFKNKTFRRQQDWELHQIHPEQSLVYQRLMLRQFTEMHKYQRLEINTNCVWKLCIYYGMFKHSFNKELEALIITLANHRFQIYKNVIAVMIYNLYKRTPALKSHTIMAILRRHKNLIDNVIRVESPALLNVHVVLMVLQILVKALSVQRIKTGHNRLEALRHLNIFIEDLNLSQLQAKQLIVEQLNLCEKHLITAEERKFLDNFKAQLPPQD